MTGPEPDEELVRRYLAGDERAFSLLVERHQTRVFNVALRVLGDPDDARDAAQDAFLSMLRKLSQFRGDSAFTTWLHRVTVNSCYDILRKRRRQPMLRLVGDEDDPIPETGPPVADHADATVDSIDVSRALLLIPEEYRVTLVLADIQDVPYEEIARVLDVPMGTVKSRVHRGTDRAGAGDGPGWPRSGTVVRPRAVGERVMTHPEELLAGYVDGTLSPQERAAVEAHVAGCARCSREVGLATQRPVGARSPRGGARARGHRVARRSRRRAAVARLPQPEGPPRWYRVGGIVGAVAAGLLVFTLVLPHVGQSDDAGGDAAGGSAAQSATPGPSSSRRPPGSRSAMRTTTTRR